MVHRAVEDFRPERLGVPDLDDNVLGPGVLRQPLGGVPRGLERDLVVLVDFRADDFRVFAVPPERDERRGTERDERRGTGRQVKPGQVVVGDAGGLNDPFGICH